MFTGEILCSAKTLELWRTLGTSSSILVVFSATTGHLPHGSGGREAEPHKHCWSSVSTCLQCLQSTWSNPSSWVLARGRARWWDVGGWALVGRQSAVRTKLN